MDFLLILSWSILVCNNIGLLLSRGRLMNEVEALRPLAASSQLNAAQASEMKLLAANTEKENLLLSECILEGRPHPEKIIYQDREVEKIVTKNVYLPEPKGFSEKEFKEYLDSLKGLGYPQKWVSIRNNYHHFNELQMNKLIDVAGGEFKRENQTFVKYPDEVDRLQHEWYEYKRKRTL